MESRKIALKPNAFYHIYNRGINGQDLFFEDRNYTFFLTKYAKYVYPYVDTFAYCLLRNHFHVLIRVKSEPEIRSILGDKHQLKSIEWINSNAFSSLFKSYAQAINKTYRRTGGFFEEPFHRVEVNNQNYFKALLVYIHKNPEIHGFVKDFRDYPFSSFHSLKATATTRLSREFVLQEFENRLKYESAHKKWDSEALRFQTLEFD